MRVPEYIINGISEFMTPFYPSLTREGIRQWLKFVPRGAVQSQNATIADAAKLFGMPVSTLRLRVKEANLQAVERRPSRGGFTRYYNLIDLQRVSGNFIPESEIDPAPPASPEDPPPAHIS